MAILRFMTESPADRRRPKDRRHFWTPGEHQTPYTPWLQGVKSGLLVLFLGTLLWQWRTVVYGPLWLVRAHYADHGDIYLGSTNGVENRDLTLRARNYLAQINQLDGSGNITPEELRAAGIHIDLDWFKDHRPESVTYNPFYEKGNFVVTWPYVPTCQRAKSSATPTGSRWYDRKGRACPVICNLSVYMAPDFQLNSIKIDPPINQI